VQCEQLGEERPNQAALSPPWKGIGEEDADLVKCSWGELLVEESKDILSNDAQVLQV
jgi:hypothetical protein